MTMLRAAALLAALTLSARANEDVLDPLFKIEPPAVDNAASPQTETQHASELPQPPQQGPLTQPLLQPTPPPPPEENFLSQVVKRLTIPLERGPLFLLPLIDRYKDLGFTYGLMPIWAMKGGENGDTVNQVYAPSFLWNQYLKSTLTYRGYYFPDDNRLVVTRAAWSQEVDRELFARYYDPFFLNTEYRLNLEAHYLVSGRPSFYGIGSDTSESKQANYAYNQIGEEATLDVPVANHLFLDLTHSFYQKRATDGPITTVPQVQTAFAQDFSVANQWANYLFHRAAIVYDSTDHAALPTRGFYANISAGTSQSALGSTYSYEEYGINLKKYFNFGNGGYITAIHAEMEQETGDTLPFYAQETVGESTGLRSVGDGRFVDRGRMIYSVEERFRISQAKFIKFVSELELTPFVDAGTVYHDPSGFKPEDLHWSYGSAFRLVLRPQVVGTLELALGKEGPNVIIHVGYPF